MGALGPNWTGPSSPSPLEMSGGCFLGAVQAESGYCCSLYSAVQELLEMQLDESQGSWLVKTPLPTHPCPQQALPPPPRLCPPLILPAHHEVPATESHLPLCVPRAVWLLLGIMLALVFSGSHCPVHVCGVTIVLTVLTPPPPPQDMPRAVTEDTRTNTSGRRPGPGWGDAGGFCVTCLGPEA